MATVGDSDRHHLARFDFGETRLKRGRTALGCGFVFRGDDVRALAVGAEKLGRRPETPFRLVIEDSVDRIAHADSDR